jgi:hypothetical protein
VSRGTHAAGDGSFGRSAGTAGLRGLLLIVIAVAIGIVLLNRATPTPAGLSSVRASSPTTAKPPKGKGGHTSVTTTIPGPTTTTSAALRPTQDVKVLVANSTSVKGQAARYTSVVHNLGYDALAAVDSTTRNLTTSIVYYQPGYHAEAAHLASQLGLPQSTVRPMPPAPPVVYVGGANVLVVVGLDLANATSTPGGTQATTTTSTVVRQAPATTAPIRTTTTAHH